MLKISIYVEDIEEGDQGLSVIRGGKGLKKKELIERVLRDLSPGLREKARRLLEEQDISVLMDRGRLEKLLKERGLL